VPAGDGCVGWALSRVRQAPGLCCPSALSAEVPGCPGDPHPVLGDQRFVLLGLPGSEPCLGGMGLPCRGLGSLGFLKTEKPFLVSDLQWASPLGRSPWGRSGGCWVCRDTGQRVLWSWQSSCFTEQQRDPPPPPALRWLQSFSEKINHPAPRSPARWDRLRLKQHQDGGQKKRKTTARSRMWQPWRGARHLKPSHTLQKPRTGCRCRPQGTTPLRGFTRLLFPCLTGCELGPRRWKKAAKAGARLLSLTPGVCPVFHLHLRATEISGRTCSPQG